MRDKKEFYNILTQLDGKLISELDQMVGDFDFSRYVVKMDGVPNGEVLDTIPFIIRVPQIIAEFPADYYDNSIRCTALEDYLTRRMADHLNDLMMYDERGISLKRISIAELEDRILPRTSMLVADEFVEARVCLHFPKGARFIDAENLIDIFFNELPEVVNESLFFYNLDQDDLDSFIRTMERSDHVRQLLPTRGMISFVHQGTLLASEALDIRSHTRTEVSIQIDDTALSKLQLADGTEVEGLGLSTGITVILGDDYSGRLELIRSIADGIFNHIPGDGREMVVTVPDAVYVAAEPGRCVHRVDISTFIDKELTRAEEFSTDCATAYESQLAGMIENLEVGAHVLLFDEQDSAPAFISADKRVKGLISEDGANGCHSLPARARQIVDELGVSIVVSGSESIAGFIPMADRVLSVRDGIVRDITEEAKKLNIESVEILEDAQKIHDLAERSRWIVPSSIDPSLGKEDAVIKALDAHLLTFGRSLIDLSGIFQIADKQQTGTIGQILFYAKLRYTDESLSICEIMDLIDRDLSTEGLEYLSPDLRGDLARPRRYEIAAALNRLDTLRISRVGA